MADVPLHWVDGVRGAQVPADDRGLLYGDGVFRTIRVDDGTADDLDGQLAHLLADADELGLPNVAASLLHAESKEAAKHLEQGVVRITLTRGSGGHGYAPPASPQVRRVLLARPVELSPKPQTLALLPPMAIPSFSAAKHLNRLVQVDAARLQPAWATSGLLQKTDTCLVCATQSNIFALDEAGDLITPPTSDGALAGRMRARVLEAARGLGLSAVEQSIPASQIDALNGMICASSVRGLQWVESVHTTECQTIKRWHAPDEIFQALQTAIKHPAHRKLP